MEDMQRKQRNKVRRGTVAAKVKQDVASDGFPAGKRAC
jgi:hypothetical protein